MAGKLLSLALFLPAKISGKKLLSFQILAKKEFLHLEDGHKNTELMLKSLFSNSVSSRKAGHALMQQMRSESLKRRWTLNPCFELWNNVNVPMDTENKAVECQAWD